MAKANPKKIPEISGWVLIARDEDADDWNIAWHHVFGTKKSALAFAQDNGWSQPYKATRGALTVGMTLA